MQLTTRLKVLRRRRRGRCLRTGIEPGLAEHGGCGRRTRCQSPTHGARGECAPDTGNSLTRLASCDRARLWSRCLIQSWYVAPPPPRPHRWSSSLPPTRLHTALYCNGHTHIRATPQYFLTPTIAFDVYRRHYRQYLQRGRHSRASCCSLQTPKYSAELALGNSQ